MRIVCFGDSNTWGYDPVTKTRYPEDIRWTGVLAKRLGVGYTVIEEGQNGRTIAMEDPCEGEKKGLDMIVPVMESQSPFDLLIVMLGTNDLKRKFSLSSIDVAGEMQIMLEKIESFSRFHMAKKPRVLLISPILVGDNIRNSWLGDCFGYENAVKVSGEIAKWYRILAKQFDCDFMDASVFAKASMEDSIHMMPKDHARLAEEIEKYIRSLNTDQDQDK